MALFKYKTLSFRSLPPVAVITLDRPRASNRVNLAMAMELRQVCQQLREDGSARAVVLTGRGNAFSSGREPISLSNRSRGSHSPWEWLELHRAASALAAVEIPLIAAINGDALDHGLELAMACDLRIAASSATLGFTDLSRGVIPWDGGTQRLPRLVGRARSLELLLTSRLMDAQEACGLGLVNMVTEPERLMSTAEELAQGIASGAPIATRYVKEAVLQGMDMTLRQGLGLEADLSVILQSTRDRAEGLSAFLEKRPPRFRGK